MKIITILFSTFLFFSISSAQNKPIENPKSHRIEKIINAQWTFNYFPGTTADKGYESPGLDDSKWPAISIPHTWSTYETTGELHPFIRNPFESDNPYWWMGWGWYRKHFSISREFSDCKVFIEFEGVQKYCKVWINGKYLGDHKGGYGSFDFDITEYVKPGEDNVLAVAVNNRQKDEFRIPPMEAADFDVYGGIYRDVTLVLKDKLFIPMQGSANHEGGTFVTTPRISEKEGIVRVQTWVKNDNLQKKTCTLQTSVVDSTDKVIQVIKSEAVINPGQLYKFDQTSKPVKNPHLWSNDDPYLYKVYTRVIDGKTVTDIYSSPLGFRWFSWDYKENFLYMNGKKVIIHGGSRSQDYPWLGDAIPKWITVMDFTDMTENLNYNFIKTSHYPNDKLVYDLADKLGIITDEESPSIKNQEFSVEVQEQQMKEMIRRDRNHPSIMLWSMGNETDHAVDSKFAEAEDSTRILTAYRVTNGSEGVFVKHTDKNLTLEDISGWSIRGWINQDSNNLNPSDKLQTDTKDKLNTINGNAVSETANICNRLYDDHGAKMEYPNSPIRYVDPSGTVDMYRIPKYLYYSWQGIYGKNLMVFIQPSFWRPQYLGLKENISVNSNCDKIELLVNGISKGFQSPDQSNLHCVTFRDILIEKGTISAVGIKNGKKVDSEIMMPGIPAKIVITGSKSKIKADRGSVVIITADIVDSRGIHVGGANNTIKWTLSGPATLVGPSTFESDINKHHVVEGVWYMEMPVSNVIRSTGKPGRINVSVSASGLNSGTFYIEAEEMESDNSAVVEPVLQDEGRSAVAKILLNVKRLEEVPREIKLNIDDLSLGSSDKPGYKKIISEYILKNNPSVDTTTIEFRTLNELFCNQLLNSGGHLTTSDYNFNVDQYNNCRLISGYINGTKLPPLFKEGLKKYYSNIIIKKGSDKNAGEEMNWLNWIPSGGTVVVVQNEETSADLKGAVITKNSGLTDIISVVYPKFINFSQEAKERALIFISKMNPYVHASSLTDQNLAGDTLKQNNVSYSADKGQPILIPLLKFISE
ncbi:MAG: sugar-binding domain-containing protein [Bacteroidales bacterium]